MPRRELIVTHDALAQMDEIWQWNRDQYDASHANAYLQGLNEFVETTILARPEKGRTVAGLKQPTYFRAYKKSGSGHGHIVVYVFTETTVVITNIFHSAQDWIARVKGKTK